MSLYVIQARRAPTAVVFRRGPSKQVQLIKWDTGTDTFEEGQWFNGRIYERRCDLSPDGNLLVYFAAKYKKPYFSWTAISKPPYLTALALWPKGDGWGGGGLFESHKTLLLNHREGERELGESCRLPSKFKVRPYGERPGGGEDEPIMGDRLTRDGWKLIQTAKFKENELGAAKWIEMEPPEVWVRASPTVKAISLRMVITGLHERDGAWYIVEHEIFDQRSNETFPLGRTSWADWSRNGDLLYAKAGALFRLRSDRIPDLEEAKQLIDLSANRFAAMEAPSEAVKW